LSASRASGLLPVERPGPTLTVKALLLAGLVVLVILQGTWLPQMRLAGVMPDAVLVALSSWAILAGGVAVVPAAAIAGVLLDLLAGTPLGLSAAALLLATLAVGWWRGTISYTGIGIFVVAGIVATFAYDSTLLVGMQSLHDTVNWPAALRHIVVPSAALNGALAVPAGYLCSAMARRLGYLESMEGVWTR
jgi:rod shape-determining protein MreD